MKSLVLYLFLFNLICTGLTNKLDKHADKKLPKEPNCGVSSRSAYLRSRILDGERTEEDEFPWVVSLLESKDSTKNNCTGTLINPRWILTAAHCLKYSKYVSFGDKKQVQIDKTIPHPNYDESNVSGIFDIGLAHLSEYTEYTKHRQPICLQSEKMNLYNVTAILAGWGAYDYPRHETEYLRKQSMTVRKDCVKLSKNEYPHNETYQICAGKNIESGCLGDLGGPFMFKKPNSKSFYQIGVASIARTLCVKTENTTPTTFEIVQKHYEWISKTIESYK